MAGKQSPSPRLFLALMLSVVLALGACSSDIESVGTSKGQEPGGEAETLEPPVLDQDLAFSRPVEPFTNDVVAVIDGDRLNVVDVATGEVVASNPTTLQPLFSQASSDGGVIYLIDERSPGQRQLIRVDAGGFETLEFESTGWVDHRTTTDGPALLTRDDEVPTQLLRFRVDGQIDRYTFGDGMFIEVLGDTIAVTPPDYTGDVWLLNADLAVIDSAHVGQLLNRPGLVDENTLRVLRDGEGYLIDLTTWDERPLDEAATNETDESVVSHEFGDGWVGELEGNVFRIIDADGEVRLERDGFSAIRFDVFAHPGDSNDSNNSNDSNALVAFRTCRSREGVVCEVPGAVSSSDSGDSGDSSDSGDTESDDSSDDVSDEPYVAPGYLEVYLFDMETAELTPLEIVPTTALAVLAVDTGWLVASIDYGLTTIASISHDGLVENFDEIPSGNRDYTQDFVIPVAPGALGFQDFSTTGVFILTDNGVVSVPGTAVSSSESWRAFAGRFDHLS